MKRIVIVSLVLSASLGMKKGGKKKMGVVVLSGSIECIV